MGAICPDHYPIISPLTEGDSEEDPILVEYSCIGGILPQAVFRDTHLMLFSLISLTK
jgi:hypothetical protein